MGFRALHVFWALPRTPGGFFGPPRDFLVPAYYIRKEGHGSNFYKIWGVLLIMAKKMGRIIEGQFL